MRNKRRWFLVAAVVLAFGLGYMGYALFSHSGDDLLTVSEAKSYVDSLDKHPLKVGGKIVPGSIDWDNKSKIIRFTLIDDSETLDVTYEGVVPDGFKPGVDLIVEGIYRPDGVFEATSFGNRRSVCSICH